VIAARISPAAFLLTLPVLMMGTLFALPWIDGPITAYAGFAMAGLSCSAFFPMLVAFTAGRSPDAISWIASMLTAAMMVGVGIGSYAVGALRGNAPIAGLYGEAMLAPVLCLACVVVSILIIRRTAS
jgi:predicted MFS family arabinose efflux permease